MWITSIYFERVNTEVSAILQNTMVSKFRLMSKDSDAESNISQLRNIHEDLCNSVRHFSEAFGPQVIFYRTIHDWLFIGLV